MRRRGAFMADCGYCTLAWDAHSGQYDLIEYDGCPDHGALFDGYEVEDEDALSQNPFHDEGRGE